MNKRPMWSVGSPAAFILILLCSMLAWLAGCDRRPSQGEHVRIAVNPTAFFLPLLVAHDQGFFAAHGLSSEILMLNSTSEATNAFLSGNAELSALGSGGLLFLDEQSRGRVKLMYVQFNRSYALLVPKDSAIRSVDDLRNKRIGVWPSPTPEIFLRMILEPRLGVNAATVVPIESRFLHQALVRGEIDAIFAADVHARTSLNTGTTRYLSEFPMEEFVQKPFFHGGGLLRTDYIAQHPDAARRIQAALEDAIAFIATHESQARESIVRHVKVDRDVAMTTAIDRFETVNDTNLALGQQVADRLTTLGILKERTDIDSLRP